MRAPASSLALRTGPRVTVLPGDLGGRNPARPTPVRRSMSLVNDAIKMVGERLRGVGVLYVDRSLIEELEGVTPRPGGTLDRHQHTDTSRAVVRISTGAALRRKLRLFRAPKDAHGHAHLWRWVIDHRPTAWPETTTSQTAYRICRMTGGLVSSARAHRLTSLSSVVFACAWPWAAEWMQSDLFRALGLAEHEILTDWLRERGNPLGPALHDFKTGAFERERLAAAIGVFEAAVDLRQLGYAFAEKRRLAISDPRQNQTELAGTDALANLLDYCRGAPWRRSKLRSAKSAVVPLPCWTEQPVVLE